MPRLNLLVAILVTIATLGLAPSASAHYNPTKGRWIERDPVLVPGIRGSTAMIPTTVLETGASTYDYARNRVLSLVDPDGLTPRAPDAALASVDENSGPWDQYWEGHPDFNEWERKLWKGLWAHQKLCMYLAYRQAYSAVAGRTGKRNGPGDAVRHCIFSCEMSRCLGTIEARKWGDAHEVGGTLLDEKYMDWENNQHGRDVFDEEMKRILETYRSDWWKHLLWTGECLGPPENFVNCKRGCEAKHDRGELKVLPEERWSG